MHHLGSFLEQFLDGTRDFKTCEVLRSSQEFTRRLELSASIQIGSDGHAHPARTDDAFGVVQTGGVPLHVSLDTYFYSESDKENEFSKLPLYAADVAQALPLHGCIAPFIASGTLSVPSSVLGPHTDILQALIPIVPRAPTGPASAPTVTANVIAV